MTNSFQTPFSKVCFCGVYPAYTSSKFCEFILAIVVVSLTFHHTVFFLLIKFAFNFSFFLVSRAFFFCVYLVLCVPLAVLLWRRLRAHLSWQKYDICSRSLKADQASIGDDIFSAECWSDWCPGCFAESGLLVARGTPNWADVPVSPRPLNLLTWISQFSTLDLSHSQGGFRNIEISIFKRSICGTSGDQPSGSVCVDFDSDLSMLPAAFPLRWQEDQRELRSKMIYWAAVWRKWKLGFFKIVKTGEQ